MKSMESFEYPQDLKPVHTVDFLSYFTREYTSSVMKRDPLIIKGVPIKMLQ